MADLDYLGTGIKFPPQIDQGTGRFALSSGYDNIKESVYIILMTQQGERWLRPSFGANLLSYTFMDTSLTMLNLMADDISETLLTQEPRIENVEVGIDPSTNDGCLIINIGYTVRATHARDSLVFPFYLNAVKEDETDEPIE